LSKLEVNQIDKTPTGTEVTVLSDLHLNQELVLAEYTTAQINAIQNPNDGALVWDSEEGTVKVYKESSGVWVQVGGTEHTKAFNNIQVAGQLDVDALIQNDTLTLIAGSDITITTDRINQTITIDHDGLDLSAVSQNIVPNQDDNYDLGSATFKWRNLYLGGDTIYMGNSEISAINVAVNDDKIRFSDPIEITGMIDNSGGTGIAVTGDMNIDNIKTDSLGEKTASNNIDLNNNLVLAAGTTIDFTLGSATGLGGSGGGTNANLLMNGSWDIWQRGTAGTSTSNGRPQSADRWVTTTNVSQISRQTFTQGQTDVPNNPQYYARWFSSNTGNCVMEQRIEGVHTGQGQDVTYSFYARTASGTKTLTTEMRQNFGVTGSYSTAVTITGNSHSIDSTWTQYTGTLNIPSTSGKTIGSQRDQATHDYLAFMFKHTGSSFDIYIANVKLEMGGSVTAFERPAYNEELYKCARYFQKVGEGTSAIIGWGGGSRNNVLDGILPYKLGPMYRFPDKIHSGQYRFVRGIYNEYGNYLNHNFNSHIDDVGWGCWNVDIGNNLTNYFCTIAGGNSSMRWMWDAEIGG
jgi:hypothetical protein